MACVVPFLRVSPYPTWMGLSVLAGSLIAAGHHLVWAFDESATMLDEIVVTARRVEAKRSETPQKIEIITREDIEKTAATDLTDVLKKMASIDVIQYNGVLSGIGIRGFRPEFSGINKRSLLLIDGRPAGAQNLATVLLDNVERIEIVKGPASALYGSSAMGGVVNVITRRSQGPLTGEARAGYGSFETYDFGAKAGGSIQEGIDFDITAHYYNQANDYLMGSNRAFGEGERRPATSYNTQSLTGRIGADFWDRWRIDGKFDVYRARDVDLPGDIFDGTTNQGSKDLDRTTGDIKLRGLFDKNALSFTAFFADEKGNNIRVTSRNPADRPFLPFKTFESETFWYGVQAQNDWQWSESHNLVTGIDYEKVEYQARSYTRTGARTGPFTPDNEKETVGLYAENTFRFYNGDTVVTLGGRYDRIETATLETAYRTNFTPSRESFNVFNPSIGFKQRIGPGWRLHATAGRAFVAPDAGQLTGFSESIVGGRTQITRGNPALDPERSFTWDVGIEYVDERRRFDLTYFRTKVEDRIARVTVANPPRPAPVIISFVNADSALIEGLELESSWQLTPAWSLFTNINYYFYRKEEVGGREVDIRNVPRLTVRAGLDYLYGPWSGRLLVRHVGERFDNDFNVAGNPIIEYPTFTVTDLYLQYRFSKAHRVSLDATNLFDRDYFEKKGYNLAGRAFLLRYHYEF